MGYCFSDIATLHPWPEVSVHDGNAPVVNLLTDLTYGLIDPRVKYQ